MQEDFIEINSVPTRICTWGKWITEEFSDDETHLIVFVSGSPGILSFYTKFLAKINENMNGIPIWSIAHAGHDDNIQTVKTPDLEGNEKLYNLEGQIKHKIDFVEKFVPGHVKVILIAYSVGARMSMELLQHPKFSNQVIQCYLMFPAIERFAESVGGRIISKIDPYFFITHYLSSLLYQFPTGFKKLLMKSILWGVGINPEDFHEGLLQICCPQASRKLWCLAIDSCKEIQSLNDSVIESNAHRLKIYYGAKDEFVRKKFYYELIAKFPYVNAELCTSNLPHMFMVKHSIETAELVIGWINEKLHDSK